MFFRELKINLKNFIIWTGSLILLYFLVFLLYNSIIQDSNIGKINEVLQSFPEDILRLLNIDIAGIDTAFGWIKTEGILFVYLIIGVYSSILGGTIVLKEQSEKTSEYLAGIPITRNKIIISKILVALLYIIILPILLFVFSWVSLSMFENYDFNVLLYLSLTPIFPSIVFFGLSLFISMFFKKTKNITGISIGLVFGSYFLQAIAEMSDKIKFVKYFSIFTLADTRNTILNANLNFGVIIISLILTVILLILSIKFYEKKELV